MTEVIAPIYDAYAPIYDAIGQGRFGEHLARWALRRLAERGARIERVLDLACGTGAAALVFAATGCAVVGVDRSAAMLEIARGKARDARYDITFLEGDIRDLPTMDQRPMTNEVLYEVRRSSFDLVTCFCDSLNYLTEDGDLDRVFANVAAVLRPGGYMVFDLNTTAEYATWDERDVMTYDGRDCIVYNQLSYDPAAHLATGRIVWFVRETEVWWRGEEAHTERAWTDAEVRAALARAGLALVERLDVEGREAMDDAARVVYIAQRQ
jgi:SAM-dependent methyltransferase